MGLTEQGKKNREVSEQLIQSDPASRADVTLNSDGTQKDGDGSISDDANHGDH